MEKKKIRLEVTENGLSISAYAPDRISFTLYAGISAIYGGWLADVDGGETLDDLEEELANADREDYRRAAEEDIGFINDLIADPSTPWEPLNERDEEYISEMLEAWGIAE